MPAFPAVAFFLIWVEVSMLPINFVSPFAPTYNHDPVVKRILLVATILIKKSQFKNQGDTDTTIIENYVKKSH